MLEAGSGTVLNMEELHVTVAHELGMSQPEVNLERSDLVFGLMSLHSSSGRILA